MKTKIRSSEAKTKLPDWLRLVKSGRSFTITIRGEAFADLVPSAGAKVRDRASAAENLKSFKQNEPVRGVDVKELVDRGRA